MVQLLSLGRSLALGLLLLRLFAAQEYDDENLSTEEASYWLTRTMCPSGIWSTAERPLVLVRWFQSECEETKQTFAEDQNDLQNFLMKQYAGREIRARPVKDPERSVDVNVHLHIVHMSFSQKEQAMTIHGHMYLLWKDYYLAWDRAKYGVNVTYLSRYQVWHPDIKIANSASGVYQEYEQKKTGLVTITLATDEKPEYAWVEMYPTFAYKVGCDLDYSKFPYDQHSCNVALYTPYTMSLVELFLYVKDPTISLSWNMEVPGKEKEKKTMVGDFMIVSGTNSISYISRGTNTSAVRPFDKRSARSTWSVFTASINFKRVSTKFLVAVTIPLLTAVLFVHASLIVDTILTAIGLDAAAVFLHVIFCHDFMLMIPPGTSGYPRCLWFYVISFAHATIVLVFHLSCLHLAHPSNGDIRRAIVQGYICVRGFLPAKISPAFLNKTIRKNGSAVTRSWLENCRIWRFQFLLFSFVFFSYLVFWSFIFI